MKRTALFPGSFDPFTVGHESIVNRALPLFDKIVIMVGYNIAKNGLFPIDKRVEWIKAVFKDSPKVEVISYSGLTIECCKEVGALFMLRGVRSSSDLEYEQSVAAINRDLNPEIESIILLSDPSISHISSSTVRELLKYRQDVSKMLPSKTPIEELYKIFNR